MQQAIDTHSLSELLAAHYGLAAAEMKPLPGEYDRNYFVETAGGGRYILKLVHPGTTREELDFQHRMLAHLAGAEPGLPAPRVIANRAGEEIATVTIGGEPRLLRLLSWLPGRLYAHVRPQTDALRASLGTVLGRLSRGLRGFDHPAAHRRHKWDVAQADWVADHLHHIHDEERRELAAYFLCLFREQAGPVLPALRRGVNYNDANDYNIVVNDGEVSGVVDFNDAVYTQTVHEPAIALAYALLDLPDPLAAAVPLLRAYHAEFPLTEAELAVLFPLVGARLLISVVNSAINRHAEPDNEYLLISERPAWDLLARLRRIPPALAHYTFRWACGLEPCPAAAPFRAWAAAQAGAFAALTGVDLAGPHAVPLDLSVGSLDLGNNAEFDDIEAFDRKIQSLISRNLPTSDRSETQIPIPRDYPLLTSRVGLGGYGEVRPFYTTDAYVVPGNEGPQWRTVHLGLDIWMPAGTPVHAPLDGVVVSAQDNAGERDYGPTIILEHRVSEELTFYTLYGHLSRASLEGKQPGMPVKKGDPIAAIGPRPENGNWPPHVHFQVMLDRLDLDGDFPGVAFPHLREVWLSICPDPTLLSNRPPLAPAASLPVTVLRERRRCVLAPNLSVSYRQPLHMVRGYRQYLYDETARRYLDTVNNVAHVGHEHPRVVRAIQRQAAVLNTNTRYLHEEILTYAGELLATLPPAFEVVYFVNSGSEANELALRLVRTCTGRDDMIVLQIGYHGNTGRTVDVSSYKFDRRGGRGAPPTTHVAPMPDPYRGPYRADDPDAGRKYAAYVGAAVARLDSTGRGVAGFIAESVLSCGGQVVPPAGFLSRAYDHIRAGGGLCIADEVQTGFGRPGDHFWAFELHGVVPDIVTMGKPIGNGHPLGAVATTRAVAEAFANGMEYFNTYGGNPVSCAAGRAVLAVIREEGLQENARTTGDYLRRGLIELQQRHPLIGDVRGPGLFLGIDLVRDPGSREPATGQATYIANRARAHGILMSTDGPHENVLKIKPPLCFSRADADFLIDTLDRLLAEDGAQPPLS